MKFSASYIAKNRYKNLGLAERKIVKRMIKDVVDALKEARLPEGVRQETTSAGTIYLYRRKVTAETAECYLTFLCERNDQGGIAGCRIIDLGNYERYYEAYRIRRWREQSED